MSCGVRFLKKSVFVGRLTMKMRRGVVESDDSGGRSLISWKSSAPAPGPFLKA